MSDDLVKRVDAILDGADMPERHTFYQLKHFIVGKECTVQGQLWQVVRELRARRESFEALSDQLEDVQDDIDLAMVHINRLAEQLHNCKAQTPEELDYVKLEARVALRKAERSLRALYRSKSNLERKQLYLSQEITYLVGAFEALSKVETIKPLDDAEAQNKYWNEKLTEELNLRIILRHPLDCDFVRTILSLDDNSPVKQQMVAIIGQIQDQVVKERERNRIAEQKIQSLKKE